MLLDRPDGIRPEAVDARCDELGPHDDAVRVSSVPQQPGPDRTTESLPQAEHGLMCGVGRDPELLGQLRRFEPVPQVEVQDARVTLAEGRRGCPHQVALLRPADRGHGIVVPDRLAARFEQLRVTGRHGASLSFEAVEGPVAGDP